MNRETGNLGRFRGRLNRSHPSGSLASCEHIKCTAIGFARASRGLCSWPVLACHSEIMSADDTRTYIIARMNDCHTQNRELGFKVLCITYVSTSQRDREKKNADPLLMSHHTWGICDEVREAAPTPWLRVPGKQSPGHSYTAAARWASTAC